MSLGMLGMMMSKAPPPLIVAVAAVVFYAFFPLLSRLNKPREPTGITPELKRLLGEPPPRKPDRK